MSVVLRLARGGQKKRPFYRIVATDKRAPRDGKFIEKLGTYNPMLAKDDPNRVSLESARIQHWLSVGAKPSERVHHFLHQAGLIESAPQTSHRPQKSRKNPGKKTRQELKAEAEAEAEAKAQAEAESKAAAEEASGEEAQPDEEAATEERESA